MTKTALGDFGCAAHGGLFSQRRHQGGHELLVSPLMSSESGVVRTEKGVRVCTTKSNHRTAAKQWSIYRLTLLGHCFSGISNRSEPRTIR